MYLFPVVKMKTVVAYVFGIGAWRFNIATAVDTEAEVEMMPKKLQHS